ncbi:hypothetical protein OA791_24585, partial [Citrobacter portucalensis]
VSPLRASIADACDKHGLCSSTGISPSNPALAAATGRAAPTAPQRGFKASKILNACFPCLLSLTH